MAESQMDAKGTKLFCNACGKTWEMDEYGRMHALDGETEFPHIPDWSNWERACVRKEIEEGTYYFEDKVRVETLPGSFKFYKQGEGTLIQTPEGTTLKCNYYGEDYTLFRSAKSLESMHIEYDFWEEGTVWIFPFRTTVSGAMFLRKIVLQRFLLPQKRFISWR